MADPKPPEPWAQMICPILTAATLQRPQSNLVDSSGKKQVPAQPCLGPQCALYSMIPREQGVLGNCTYTNQSYMVSDLVYLIKQYMEMTVTQVEQAKKQTMELLKSLPGVKLPGDPPNA